MPRSILIVEDEAIIAQHLRATLEDGGYRIAGMVNSVNKALLHIQKERPSLVIIDIYLKGELTGIHLAHSLNKIDIPFIFVSANCDREVLDAAKATRPYGFIVKPFREKDLLVMLDIASYHHEHNQQLVSHSRKNAQKSLPQTNLSENNFEGIIGKSPAMLEIFEMVRQVAPLDTTVLVLGESGTGKEGVASAIHKHSPRNGKPYIKINCAALPAQLIESELFGHEKGAFTGAHETRIGKFEQAEGGTIFLDEIGDMPADLQVKLLRVLQERQIERLGGTRTIEVNVRVIAATNRNLESRIADGLFRLDLYYRLNVFPIHIPPLRSRKTDIPLLVSFFIDHFRQRTGKLISTMDDDALQELTKYPWPGNIRELQNVLERAILLAKGEVLSNIYLPVNAPGAAVPTPPAVSLTRTMEEMEREHIISILEKCNQRISGVGGAAALLDLPPSTLYSRMKKLGITIKKW